MMPYTVEGEIEALMDHLIAKIREAKPDDRGPIDRAYAVTLTDLEKVAAYWNRYATQRAQAIALGSE